jgi:hypothetical protein
LADELPDVDELPEPDEPDELPESDEVPESLESESGVVVVTVAFGVKAILPADAPADRLAGDDPRSPEARARPITSRAATANTPPTLT